MKKEVFSVFVLFFLVSFASAAFSIGEIFDDLDQSTIVLGTLFIIFFALSYLALSKFFTRRDRYGNEIRNNPTATVISLCVSLLAVYGIYISDIGIESILELIGGYSILVGIGLLGAIFLVIKTKGGLLLPLGIFFIIISLTEVVYENTLVMVIGVIMIFIYIFLKRFVVKNKK